MSEMPGPPPEAHRPAILVPSPEKGNPTALVDSSGNPLRSEPDVNPPGSPQDVSEPSVEPENIPQPEPAQNTSEPQDNPSPSTTTEHEHTPPDPQKETITRVAKTLLIQKSTQAGKTLRERLKGISQEEEKKIFTEQPEDLPFDNLYAITNYHGQQQVLLYQEVNQITIEHNSKQYKIKSMDSLNGDMVVCTLEGADGEITQELSRTQILERQMLVDKDVLLGNFQGASKNIIGHYFASLENPQTPLPQPGSSERTALDETLKQAAEEAGMLTTDHVHRFFDALRATTHVSEIRALNLKIINAQRVIEGKTLLDAQMTKSVFEALGVDMSPSALVEEVEAAKNKVTELTANVKNYPDHIPYQKELEKAQKALIAVEKSSRLFELAEGNPLQGYFAKLEAGDFTKEYARDIQTAFATGNIEKMVEIANPELIISANDSVEEREAKQKKKEEQIEKAKKGGKALGILAMLFLVLAAEVNPIK